MKALQELLALQEADKSLVEVADVVKSFPNKKRAAVEALLESNRLAWHGRPVMDIYSDMEDAAKSFISNEMEFEVYLEVNGPDNEDGDYVDVVITYEIRDVSESDMQEVYLGYDADKDCMLMGFDVWAGNDDDFNTEFDEAFEKAVGEQYDHDNSSHEEVYNLAWKEYNDQNLAFFGAVVEIREENGAFTVSEAQIAPQPGGFYKRLYARMQRTADVDIRLD